MIQEIQRRDKGAVVSWLLKKDRKLKRRRKPKMANLARVVSMPENLAKTLPKVRIKIEARSNWQDAI